MTLALLTLALAGCFSSRSEGQYRVQGNVAGQPVTLVASSAEEASSGVDVGAAIAAAMAGVRGDLLGAVERMRPAPIDFAPLTQRLDAIKPAPVDLSPILSELSQQRKNQEGKFPLTETASTAAAVLLAYLAAKKREQTKRGA